MKEHTEKIYMLLTALSKVFDSQTFDIHRDTIAELLSITNGIVTLCMKSLKEKHEVIEFNMTDEREYTVTLIKPSQGIYDDVLKYSKEDVKKMDETNLNNYKKLLEGQKMKEKEAQHEGLKKFLEEKRNEQIDNGNKTEMLLKDVFDELGIKYDYQHIEIIEDDEGKEHGYIYDFLVEIGDNEKYDIEVDGSSHDGKEEHDKERDELSKKIGIYPRRFSTQMVYAIYDEVSKGKLKREDVAIIIRNGLSSISGLIEYLYAISSNGIEYMNKINDFEFRNRSILESKERWGSSLMNDEDNKYIDGFKDFMNENTCGKYDEVIYGGKIIPTVTCETPFASVTCGTNGYKGGDWGHGSRAYVKVEGISLGGYHVRKVEEFLDGLSNGFEIAVGGDWELESLIETFETIATNLKKMQKDTEAWKKHKLALECILSSKKKSKDEHDSLSDAKDRQKEVRDEMVRECFLLSKKD